MDCRLGQKSGRCREVALERLAGEGEISHSSLMGLAIITFRDGYVVGLNEIQVKMILT